MRYLVEVKMVLSRCNSTTRPKAEWKKTGKVHIPHVSLRHCATSNTHLDKCMMSSLGAGLHGDSKILTGQDPV